MDRETAQYILAAWGLGDVELMPSAGGTAGGCYRFRHGDNHYLLRQRSREQLDPQQIEYEHNLLQHLGESGLPVYPPIPASDGLTWQFVDSSVYGVYPWVQGEIYQPGNPEQLTSLARTMGAFHAACVDYPAKPNQPREDDPARLQRELIEFTSEADRQTHPELFRALGNLLEEIGRHLTVVDKLPQSVVHGDLHPGNVLFRVNEVSGLFDFDWVNRRERARDIADGILFFCRKTSHPTDASDIWSLTEFGEMDKPQVRNFMGAYSAISPITLAEIEALPWIMAARLAQVRIRGMRKVQPHDRINFLDRGNIVETIVRFARQRGKDIPVDFCWSVVDSNGCWVYN